ncbi:MAG: hypothetical protein L6455_01365 [Kiritimatiellae bacterium]|nr:hypothetical protein [Verrucomicrobiota bacterium]MBU4291210.1 hypothetical protein [Verrucomicrobiota bacterium]MCG2678611.1 hypothetical protein [Kiritimatiellia bacterium]
MKKIERLNNKWAYRTLKARKAELKKYLAQTFNGLTLESFFVDRAVFSAAERQIRIAYKAGAKYVNRRALGNMQLKEEEEEEE